MERETGVEPATSSLGSKLSKENKEHRIFLGVFRLSKTKPSSLGILRSR